MRGKGRGVEGIIGYQSVNGVEMKIFERVSK